MNRYKIFLEGDIHYKTDDYTIKGDLIYFKDKFGVEKVIPTKRLIEITEVTSLDAREVKE